MSTKQQTLADVTAAMEAVDAASQDPEITPAMQVILDDASNALQQIQDTIVLQDEATWVTNLAATNDQLCKLNDKIDELCKQMDHITATVKKVSDAIGTVVTVVSAAVAAGVL